MLAAWGLDRRFIADNVLGFEAYMAFGPRQAQVAAPLQTAGTSTQCASGPSWVT